MQLYIGQTRYNSNIIRRHVSGTIMIVVHYSIKEEKDYNQRGLTLKSPPTGSAAKHALQSDLLSQYFGSITPL
jgi:hypothetical protein